MTTVNTTPLTYNGYVTQIGLMAVVDTFTPTTNTTINGITYLAGVTYGGTPTSPDINFNNIIPQMLNYAELRIQRDLDLFPFETSNSYTLNASNNVFSFSINDFVVVRTIAVVQNNQTNPLTPTSKEYIQNVYGQTNGSGMPVVFAPYGGDFATDGNTYQNYLLGPSPDQNYPVVVTGLIRMGTLNNYNTSSTANANTTFISSYLPDLLIMASMVYISAYQRNFGRMSDDPAMAQSYEGQYQALLRPALGEEYRKKFEASAWSSTSTAPVATPTRG